MPTMWAAIVVIIVGLLTSVLGGNEVPAPTDQFTDSGETVIVGGSLLPASTYRQLVAEAAAATSADKRSPGQNSWNKLNLGFSGKRASSPGGWNRLNGSWGKRAADTTSAFIGMDGDGSTAGRWNQLTNLWGKRGPGANPQWNNLNQLWGKRGWNDMKGEWGKRANPHWNNLRGMWG